MSKNFVRNLIKADGIIFKLTLKQFDRFKKEFYKNLPVGETQLAEKVLTKIDGYKITDENIVVHAHTNIEAFYNIDFSISFKEFEKEFNSKMSLKDFVSQYI